MHQSFCTGHVNRTLSMLEILDPHNMRHTHLRGSFFQAQISNQPINQAGGSPDSSSSTPHKHSPRHQVPTTTHLYPQIAQQPPIHFPRSGQHNPRPFTNAIPAHTSKGDTHANPGNNGPNVNDTRDITRNAHNAHNKEIITRELRVPLHTRHIIPTPNPTTTPLRRSQQIADLGILSSNTPPDDTPAHNTRSKVQERSITQEAILACMTTYNYITSCSLTPANASRCSFPVEILNAAFDKDTGELLEMHHLLANPKY